MRNGTSKAEPNKVIDRLRGFYFYRFYIAFQLADLSHLFYLNSMNRTNKTIGVYFHKKNGEDVSLF